MKSPFPGMDPFLEGDWWVQTHHMLAAVGLELIAPQLPRQYVVAIEKYTYLDAEMPELMSKYYPDVAVFGTNIDIVSEPATQAIYHAANRLTPPTIKIPPVKPAIKLRIPYLEIRDAENNRLITSIEILSPVNKRNPGLETYRKKRTTLQENSVNFLEIDLLRQGTRPFSHPVLPPSHYLVLLWRAETGETEAWTLSVRDKLPAVPIPLKSPDPDVKLDLGKAFDLVYERSYLKPRIKYSAEPPPPAFSEEDWLWMRQLLKIERQMEVPII